LKVEQDWKPLSFSQNGEVKAAGIVFAGYGIETPEATGTPRRSRPTAATRIST
jgi:hypothetical protein